MLSSSFVLRASIQFLICGAKSAFSQTTYTGGDSGPYQLVDSYTPANFFSKFTFFTVSLPLQADVRIS